MEMRRTLQAEPFLKVHILTSPLKKDTKDSKFNFSTIRGPSEPGGMLRYMGYIGLLKTGSLDNAIRDFSLA